MLQDRIKEERSRKKLTQEELGQIIGITQQAVGRWEKGIASPDREVLEKLADFFDVSVDYLLGRSDIRNYPKHQSVEIIAAHRADDPMSDLPPEALDELEKLKQYVISKYRKDKPNDK
jgi:Predicted transcriptional regulators